MQIIKVKSHILIIVAILALASCGYKQKNIMFKTPKKIKGTGVVIYKLDSTKVEKGTYYHVIKPGDRVQVKFINNYDIGQAAGQSATSTGNLQTDLEKGYLVNFDSTCILPLIGRINLVGLNRLEAAKALESEYSKYNIAPLIEVNITSLTVTVMGEVNMPGKILLDKENTTLVDALALAGGIKDMGKKNSIKIIRKHEVIQVDLKWIMNLKSQELIIQDGDIVYVEPYGFKAQTEALTSIQSLGFVVLTFSQLTLLTLQIINLSR